MTTEPGLLEGIATTRAIRRFTPDDVPVEDLSTMLFAATRAPSGHNTQPFRFIVLRRTPDTVEVRRVLRQGFRTAWSVRREEPEPDDNSRRARMARTMNNFVDTLDEVPVIVLATFQFGRVVDGMVAGASVFPACHNLLLAARALGYGGVLTQWHRPVEDRLATMLDLPADVTIAATIPLGRPVGRHGPVRRLPLHELVYDGRFGARAEWAHDPPGTRYTGG